MMITLSPSLLQGELKMLNAGCSQAHLCPSLVQLCVQGLHDAMQDRQDYLYDGGVQVG